MGQTNKPSDNTPRFIYLNLKENHMSENYGLKTDACNNSIAQLSLTKGRGKKA